MKTKYFTDENIDFDDVEKSLKNGGLIIYPTDTVYGLGAHINSLEAVKNIYIVKRRDTTLPLIALISQKEEYKKIAFLPKEKMKLFDKLSQIFWPGGLTIILKKKKEISNVITSNKETIGVRVPKLEIARKIIDRCGGILLTTSANISKEKTPISYEEVNEKIKNQVDIVVKTNSPLLGIESTIVDLSGSDIEILREGAIKRDDIEKIIHQIKMEGE